MFAIVVLRLWRTYWYIMEASQIVLDFDKATDEPLICPRCEHYRMQYEMSLIRGRCLQTVVNQYVDEMRALFAANGALGARLHQMQSSWVKAHKDLYAAELAVDEYRRINAVLQTKK